MGLPAEIREYRITQPGPWFRVEGGGDWKNDRNEARDVWTPIARFLTHQEADEYVQDVRARQTALLRLR